MLTLEQLYALERNRLYLLSETDTPQGEYASPVFSAGNYPADVMLIGEAPGAEETKAACPFVGKAGKQLDSLLEQANIDRQQLFVTNVVKYRPVVRSVRTTKNRTPSQMELLDGLPLLKEEILQVQPHIIVTLGNTPLRAVLMLAERKYQTIGELHGTPIPIEIAGQAYTLFALYHPASCIYNRSLLPQLEADAYSLGEHLVKAVKNHEKL